MTYFHLYPTEYVVAESVVVIKNLLQTQAADHFEIISQMAKLIDFITVPAARASILWVIGEYCEKVPKIAPDVLRKLAKTFTEEVCWHCFIKYFLVLVIICPMLKTTLVSG